MTYECRSSGSKSKCFARSRDGCDQEVMQALVTAGAMVASADGVVAPVERAELANFIFQQGFVHSISLQEIAAAFDVRVQMLDDRNAANVILDSLRPLAGLSLGSVVVRVAQRVAAADKIILERELQAINLIRLIMMELSARRQRQNA